MRRRIGTLGCVTLAIAVVLSCGSIPEEELVCEEAVSKLIDCCPGFDPRRTPCVRSSGCNSDETRPTFSEDASHCILDKECSSIRTDGVCERVVKGQSLPYTLKGAGTAFDQEVCR